MALTRKQVREWLSEAGLDEDKLGGVIDKIFTGHSGTVEALQERIDTLQKEADKVPTLTKERDDAQKLVNDGKGWKDKYDTLQKEHDTNAKRGLLRDALKAANANEAVIELMLNSADLDKVEVENGKLKDSEAAIKPFKEQHAGLFATIETKPNPQPTPPAGSGGATTAESIMKISDRAVRREAIARNLQLFEKKE